MKRLLVPATATNRIAAFTGVLFLALALVAPEPNIGAERPSAEQVKQFYLENQQSFRASLLLVGLAYAFFLCFLAVVRSELRRAEGGSGTLSSLAMGSGLLLAGFSVLGNALHVVPAVVRADTDPAQAETWRVFGEEAYDTLVEASTFWIGVMMAAVSLVVLRQGGLPRWLGWTAAVIGAAALIGPIGFVDSPVEPVMEALGFGSKIAFHFWILLASIVLTVRVGRAPASQPISRDNRVSEVTSARAAAGSHFRLPVAAAAILVASMLGASTAAAQEPPTCVGLAATIVGTPGDDTIVGTPGDDVIVGLAGDDEIWALGGTDRVCGEQDTVAEGDDDVIYGGDGVDRIYGESGIGDVGTGGDDKLYGGEGVDRIYGENLSGEVATGGDDEIYGGAGDDVHLIGDGASFFSGTIVTGGDDQIFGEAGNDIFLSGDGGFGEVVVGGDDLLDGGEGNEETLSADAFIVGTGGGDVVLGGPGDDFVLTGDGAFVTRGGDDVIDGGPGNDLNIAGDGAIVGTGGDDVIDGGDGDDDIAGDSITNPFTGTGGTADVGGDDLINGGDGNDTITGDAEAEVTTGGDDELFGNAGNDAIDGDQLAGESPDGGDDFLDGGIGIDPLDGDTGSDECMNGEPAINCEDDH